MTKRSTKSLASPVSRGHGEALDHISANGDHISVGALHGQDMLCTKERQAEDVVTRRPVAGA